MVVGWGTYNVLITALDNQQMAILNAGDELHTLAALAFVNGVGKVFVEVINQYACILSLQITPIVGDNLAIFEGDDVTADGKIVVCHFVTNAGSLQRTATFVHLVQVISQNGCVCHF